MKALSVALQYKLCELKKMHQWKQGSMDTKHMTQKQEIAMASGIYNFNSKFNMVLKFVTYFDTSILIWLKLHLVILIHHY